MTSEDGFDPECRECPRLSEFLARVKKEYPVYHARPVAPFGDGGVRLIVVGLAPGMHGANASGRPFTGDYAGILLYRALFSAGFSDRPESLHAGDGLQLRDCRITNAVKCLPPQNKPTGAEIKQCNRFLAAELAATPPGAVFLALGSIAHQAVLRARGLALGAHPFKHHGHVVLPDGRHLLSSYHCSRYNVQTKRLDQAMLDAVFVTARRLLET